MLLRKLVELGNQKHVERLTLGWDDPLPVSLNREWEHWRDALIHLKNVLIPRCYHGKEFCQVTSSELHAFSDASEEAIATAIYLKQISSKEEISVSLVYAQAKLVPKQPTTVPRLE
jgi:hypothetical protein